MVVMQKVKAGRQRRINRVRSRVVGTADRPRLAVSISNRHVRAQLIDDTAARTLISVTTLKQTLPPTLSERARWAGTELAKQAKQVKITKVVLDRRHKPYHGRVKAFAEAARAEGLEF